MFKHLETFMINMLEVDVYFTVFPHNLSKYKSMEEMPKPIDDPDLLPNDVDKWLTYFPQAQPQARGGYTYTLVLLGFREPFPKIIKVTVSWFCKIKFGLWKSSLQSEKLVALGWLLFLTSTMDVEVLKGEVSLRILSIPVGLHWKMISMGAQGSIPQEQQVKALHLYINKLDAVLAKLLLMNLYTNKLAQGHTFPLHVHMCLIPELDTILNTKGQSDAEQLQACQNTWLVERSQSSKHGR